MKVEGVFTSGHREASRFGRDVFACDLQEFSLENNESRWSKTGGCGGGMPTALRSTFCFTMYIVGQEGDEGKWIRKMEFWDYSISKPEVLILCTTMCERRT